MNAELDALEMSTEVETLIPDEQHQGKVNHVLAHFSLNIPNVTEVSLLSTD